MLESNLYLDQKEAFLRKVTGKVFHVTNSENMESIRLDGNISPNKNLTYSSAFGHRENGYFRLRDCVSFFDYRNYGSELWNEFAYRCFPTLGVSRNNPITVLFLCPSQYSKLLPWVGWKREEAWSEQIVPHIEAGYPGKVSLMHITESLVVTV